MHAPCWTSPALFLAIFNIFHSVANLGDLCWREGYDAKRCCEQKDASCWDGVFTEARCCSKGDGSLRAGSRGNPICWLDGYSYEDCCGATSKAGCWDSEFTAERCCHEPSDDELVKPLDVTQVDMSEAYMRAMADAADSPLGCTDSPSGLWRSVKLASVALNLSRQYGMPGERPNRDTMKDMVQHATSWAQDKHAWMTAKASCPEGCLNLINLVILHIDKEFGIAQARHLYSLHQELMYELERVDDWQPQTAWPLLSDGFDYVPLLLGLSQRHSCYGSSLRIYIYRLARFSHMTAPLLTCSQKMSQCTASVFIYRWLESGGCITDDAEKADLFYLPAFEACYNETACGFGNTSEHDTERCYTHDFNPATDLPYFSRHRGTDHFFIFGCNLLPFRDPLMIAARQSVMVTVESYQAENRAGPNMLAWLSYWKDVLIPGYIPSWRISAMLAFNRPMLQRPNLVAFHGHSPSSGQVGHMYQRSPLADVRDRIINYFWNASRSSVGPPVRDYFRRMGMSRFCLIPAGLTAWTIHLYEAFFFGCVPVILSDELTVPFQNEIDWPSLSIQVPVSIDMADLHAKLETFSVGRLKAMYRQLTKARCWFDYSRGWGTEGSSEDGCSPYKGLMSGLQARARRGQQLYHLRPSWEPPPRT